MGGGRRTRGVSPLLAGVAGAALVLSIAVSAVADPPRAQRPNRHAEPRRQQQPPRDEPLDTTSGTLFDNVVTVLRARFYDERFRRGELENLACRYAEPARRAATPDEQRLVVQEMLSHVPASHLGLWSPRAYERLLNDIQGQRYPTFGFQLLAVGGKFYATSVLEGGPAAGAGVLPWDRVASIDGGPVERSARLEWRSDDAHLADDRDPPVHALHAGEGDAIALKLEREPGRFLDVTVTAGRYSAVDAARASARVIPFGGRQFGYVHFWYVHGRGVPELLAEKLKGDFAACDAVVLDLRGRGGSGEAVPRVLAVLNGEMRPAVALVDRQTRSAKDVLAYELKETRLARVVGERTAGAVVPASVFDVGHDVLLMCPTNKVPHYTDLLELKPVEPHVFVERAGPHSAGADPILEAGLAEALRLVNTAPAAAVVP